MLERLASANADHVRIIKTNATENRDWAEKLDVRSVPAFYFYAQGQKVEQFSGTRPENVMQQKIDNHVKSADSGASEGEKATEPAIRPMPKNWLPPGISEKK